MVKITDVAKAAGVSPSTVSHVLNGKRPISQKTRERVLKAIKELNYIPNAYAQAMKSDRTGIIGFIATEITDQFSNMIIQGVESVFVPSGDHLLFVSGSEFSEDLGKTLKFLGSRRLDGAIISQSITESKRKLNFKLPDIPLISVNFDFGSDIPSVVLNNYKSGWDAAFHLAQRGCHRVGAIGGPEDRVASNDRLIGFRNAAEECGLVMEQKEPIYVSFGFEGGVQGMESLLQQKLSLDGIFCANDYIASGAMYRASEEGILIPDELKVIGFDNRDFSSFTSQDITTFDQPLYDMGRIAARHLMEKIRDGRDIPLQTILSSRLIARGSTQSEQHSHV